MNIPTELVANDNNVNNVDDHDGDDGGNIDNNGESTSTGGESSRQPWQQLRGR